MSKWKRRSKDWPSRSMPVGMGYPYMGRNPGTTRKKIHNESGSTLTKGAVIVVDWANMDSTGRTFGKQTTTEGEGQPLGIMASTVATGSSGFITTQGPEEAATTDAAGDIAAGDALGTSTGDGLAGKVFGSSGSVGYAIDAQTGDSVLGTEAGYTSVYVETNWSAEDLTSSAAITIPINQVMAADGAYLALAETAGDFFLKLGTNLITMDTEDAVSSNKTDVGYAQFVLPPEYLDGTNLSVNFHCSLQGAGTPTLTVGDTFLDLSAYRQESGAVGSDLVANGPLAFAAKTTWYDKAFTVTGATLASGDVVLLKFTSKVTESAAGALAFNGEPITVAMDIRNQ